MKKSLVAGLVVAVTAQLAGCGYTPEQRATSGAIVDASAVAPPPRPKPPPRCARWSYDVYGNPVCIAYYGD